MVRRGCEDLATIKHSNKPKKKIQVGESSLSSLCPRRDLSAEMVFFMIHFFFNRLQEESGFFIPDYNFCHALAIGSNLLVPERFYAKPYTYLVLPLCKDDCWRLLLVINPILTVKSQILDSNGKTIHKGAYQFKDEMSGILIDPRNLRDNKEYAENVCQYLIDAMEESLSLMKMRYPHKRPKINIRVFSQWTNDGLITTTPVTREETSLKILDFIESLVEWRNLYPVDIIDSIFQEENISVQPKDRLTRKILYQLVLESQPIKVQDDIELRCKYSLGKYLGRINQAHRKKIIAIEKETGKKSKYNSVVLDDCDFVSDYHPKSHLVSRKSVVSESKGPSISDTDSSPVELSKNSEQGPKTRTTKRMATEITEATESESSSDESEASIKTEKHRIFTRSKGARNQRELQRKLEKLDKPGPSSAKKSRKASDKNAISNRKYQVLYVLWETKRTLYTEDYFEDRSKKAFGYWFSVVYLETVKHLLKRRGSSKVSELSYEEVTSFTEFKNYPFIDQVHESDLFERKWTPTAMEKKRKPRCDAKPLLALLESEYYTECTQKQKGVTKHNFERQRKAFHEESGKAFQNRLLFALKTVGDLPITLFGKNIDLPTFDRQFFDSISGLYNSVEYSELNTV